MPQLGELRRISAPSVRFPVCRLRRAAHTVRVRSLFWPNRIIKKDKVV